MCLKQCSLMQVQEEDWALADTQRVFTDLVEKKTIPLWVADILGPGVCRQEHLRIDTFNIIIKSNQLRRTEWAFCLGLLLYTQHDASWDESLGRLFADPPGDLTWTNAVDKALYRVVHTIHNHNQLDMIEGLAELLQVTIVLLMCVIVLI